MTANQEEQIKQLQQIEHTLQHYLSQKQQFQSQLHEIENALQELNESEDPYKIIGNIMVKTSKDALVKELTEKKEVVMLRIQSLEAQEKKLKEKADSLKKAILGDSHGTSN